MLDPDALKNRIHAARLLRGLTQNDLGALFEADGLGKQDPGRIERGRLTMQAAHRRAFVHHLRMPDAWFTEPDVDQLIRREPAPAGHPVSARELVAEAIMQLGVARLPEPPGELGRRARVGERTAPDQTPEENRPEGGSQPGNG